MSYDPEDQGCTPMDFDTRANARAMGRHLAEWGVPVGLDGYQVVDPSDTNTETTSGRGYLHEADAAGRWLAKNDPTGHGVKRKPGRPRQQAA